MARKLSNEERAERKAFKEMLGPSRKEPDRIRCAYCRKLFQDTDLGMLSRAIQQHKPACSVACNKMLGQV